VFVIPGTQACGKPQYRIGVRASSAVQQALVLSVVIDRHNPTGSASLCVTSKSNTNRYDLLEPFSWTSFSELLDSSLINASQFTWLGRPSGSATVKHSPKLAPFFDFEVGVTQNFYLMESTLTITR
jgi:hypothetical protein